MAIFCGLSFENVYAKRFAGQFAEFELPPGWECALEGSEWVCQSENKDRQKEAIIILAAKIRGEQDTLDKYNDYLKKPKSFRLPGGQTQVSEPKTVAVKEINQQRWVDAMHLASEVPGFYTRYLATIKEDLGVAVTFSVAKDHYDSYRLVFDKVVETLRVFRQAKSGDNKFALKKTDENLLGSNSTYDELGEQFDIQQKKGKTDDGAGGDDSGLWMGLGALALIAGFIIWKKKQKNS
jgi:LPXTG-motif cell wall-anchored protein